jgi:hypothetical protein
VHVIDLFEAVEVQEEHGVRCAGSGRCREGRLEGVVELPAIRQTREAVLKGQLPDALLSEYTARDLALLFEITAYGEGE